MNREGTSSARVASSRFDALLARCSRPGVQPAARAVFEDLRGRYSEPHRHYHTLAHLEHCLGQFDLAREMMPDANAVEIALWYHDVIYEPGAADNERRSADLFIQQCGAWVSAEFRRAVVELILATIHDRLPATVDAQYTVDIDLSSLGLPWDQFERDSEAVRRECARMPDERFYPRQAQFLNALLGRERLYATGFFHDRLEAPARANLARYLAALRARGYG